MPRLNPIAAITVGFTIALSSGCGGVSGPTPDSRASDSAALSSAPTRTSMLITEMFDPYNVFGGGPVGEFLSLGSVACPGFTPTGNPVEPCPPGSATHFRRLELLMRSTSDAASGWLTLVVNKNEDANGEGPLWGTWREVLDDEGGGWAGTFEGTRHFQADDCPNVNPCWREELKLVGRGTPGAQDGSQFRGTNVIWSYQKVPLALLSTVTAEIFWP